MLWSTVGGSRLPSDLVLLRVTRAGLVASPAVTQKGIQSVSCSWMEQTYCDFFYEIMCVM